MGPPPKICFTACCGESRAACASSLRGWRNNTVRAQIPYHLDSLPRFISAGAFTVVGLLSGAASSIADFEDPSPGLRLGEEIDDCAWRADWPQETYRGPSGNPGSATATHGDLTLKTSGGHRRPPPCRSSARSPKCVHDPQLSGRESPGSDRFCVWMNLISSTASWQIILHFPPVLAGIKKKTNRSNSAYPQNSRFVVLGCSRITCSVPAAVGIPLCDGLLGTPARTFEQIQIVKSARRGVRPGPHKQSLDRGGCQHAAHISAFWETAGRLPPVMFFQVLAIAVDVQIVSSSVWPRMPARFGDSPVR